jgi:hypothetical protein
MRFIHIGVVLILCAVCFGAGIWVGKAHTTYTAKEDLKIKLNELKLERLEYAAKQMQRLDVDNAGRDRLLVVFDSLFFTGNDTIPE